MAVFAFGGFIMLTPCPARIMEFDDDLRHHTKAG